MLPSMLTHLPNTPRRALVIDDDPSNREAFAGLLETEGYQVLQAADGCSGFAQIQTAHPDLVITDIDLPSLDGLALVRAVHADAELCHIPVLATSGLTLTEAQANEFGAVLRKPVDPDQFLQTVARMLALRGAPKA